MGYWPLTRTSSLLGKDEWKGKESWPLTDAVTSFQLLGASSILAAVKKQKRGRLKQPCLDLHLTPAFLQWTTPQQLHGIGQYAADAYYIFCRNQWRKRQPPQDKDLLKYYEWLRLTGGEGTGCQREIFAAPASSASATSIEAVAQSDNGSSKAQPFVPMARSS